MRINVFIRYEIPENKALGDKLRLAFTLPSGHNPSTMNLGGNQVISDNSPARYSGHVLLDSVQAGVPPLSVVFCTINADGGSSEDSAQYTANIHLWGAYQLPP